MAQAKKGNRVSGPVPVTKSLKLTRDEIEVLLQGLGVIGWDALPAWHSEHKAAASVLPKLQAERLRLALKAGGK